jgi:hypothetical protein
MLMLTITDADRSLAAELGLLLVRQPESEDNAKLATDVRAARARAPETWTVKVAITKRPVGRLHFTEADSLYASKFTSGVSGIEETVADALRWIAPIVRHARTGQYDGTETIVRRFGSVFERPRAITECGAKSTGADLEPIAAKSALVNGDAGELCPACRAQLEERGVRDLSNLFERRGSSTPKQRAYIRCLIDEAAHCGRPYLVDVRTLDQMSSRSASTTIDALRSLKARDWKGDL